MPLLVRGELVEVPGLTTIPPASHGGPEWAKLDPDDYRMRPRDAWIRQIIVHTTKGMWPQRVKPGYGPGGRDKVVADFWRKDPQHSAAQIVIDNDGSVVCLCDLALIAAHHATVSNPWSIGVEIYQEGGGGIFDAALGGAMLLVPRLCEIFEIAFQISSEPYAGTPLRRMINGGPDCVGVFGHRDNTSRRGRGDPGDEFFVRMRAVGAEQFNFDLRGDRAAWKRRQGYLNATFPDSVKQATGEILLVDGIAGPKTIRAARTAGFVTNASIPA